MKARAEVPPLRRTEAHDLCGDGPRIGEEGAERHQTRRSEACVRGARQWWGSGNGGGAKPRSARDHTAPSSDATAPRAAASEFGAVESPAERGSAPPPMTLPHRCRALRWHASLRLAWCLPAPSPPTPGPSPLRSCGGGPRSSDSGARLLRTLAPRASPKGCSADATAARLTSLNLFVQLRTPESRLRLAALCALATAASVSRSHAAAKPALAHPGTSTDVPEDAARGTRGAR